mmetsp:Transcript_106295/g.299073  ORF Transcript_106295/g.299073 Transcript_106295/m.299073 type:complete len:427 (+) Transcript_106295:103-1383(+)
MPATCHCLAPTLRISGRTITVPSENCRRIVVPTEGRLDAVPDAAERARKSALATVCQALQFRLEARGPLDAVKHAAIAFAGWVARHALDIHRRACVRVCVLGGVATDVVRKVALQPSEGVGALHAEVSVEPLAHHVEQNRDVVRDRVSCHRLLGPLVRNTIGGLVNEVRPPVVLALLERPHPTIFRRVDGTMLDDSVPVPGAHKDPWEHFFAQLPDLVRVLLHVHGDVVLEVPRGIPITRRRTAEGRLKSLRQLEGALVTEEPERANRRGLFGMRKLEGIELVAGLRITFLDILGESPDVVDDLSMEGWSLLRRLLARRHDVVSHHVGHAGALDKLPNGRTALHALRNLAGERKGSASVDRHQADTHERERARTPPLECRRSPLFLLERLGVGGLEHGLRLVGAVHGCKRLCLEQGDTRKAESQAS